MPDIPDEKVHESSGSARMPEKSWPGRRIGYWQDAWRRFRENKIALVAAVILIVMIFFIIFGPMISGYGFEEIDNTAINQGPSAEALVWNG